MPSTRVKAIHDWPGKDQAFCVDAQPDGSQDVDSGHGTHTATSIVSGGNAQGVGRAAAYAAKLVFQSVEDYADVPWWLGDAYPSLFDYPGQIDRIRIYSIAYDVRDLLAAPPTIPLYRLSELHAYHRLARVVQRKSYIDVLGRGRI